MKFSFKNAFILALGLGLASSYSVAASLEQLNEQYKKDLQYCESAAVLDKEACRKEAGAALQSAKKGDLTETVGSASAQNRCQYLSGENKKDCELLMEDSGVKTQGSVESGGVIRVLEIEYTPSAEEIKNNQSAPDINNQLEDGVEAKTYTVE